MSSATDPARSVVGTELFVALAAVVNGVLIAASVGFGVARWWWLGVAVAIGTALLAAAADRDAAELWAFAAVGIAAVLAIPLTMAFDALPVGVLPIVMIAVGVGMAANRVAFGLLRPVPQFRRERQS